MKSRRIYNHENLKKDHKFQKMIKNAEKLSVEKLWEESDKLWRENTKREMIAKSRKRKLRDQQEQMEEEAKLEELGLDIFES